MFVRCSQIQSSQPSSNSEQLVRVQEGASLEKGALPGELPMMLEAINLLQKETSDSARGK